jgi:alpha-2-macroglobulin
MNKEHPLLSWQFMLLKLAVFGLITIILQQPTGSIKGRLSLEEKGFHVRSYDVRANHMYVTAVGTGKLAQIERGVWVNNDGTFQINQLPKGEYSFKARATGFETLYKYGVFVDDGKVIDLGDHIALSILNPSVTIASNTRVFTTKEAPRFWLSATGANKAVVKIYRFSVLDLVQGHHEKRAKGNSDDDKGVPSGREKAEASQTGLVPTTTLTSLKLNLGTNLELIKEYQSADPLSRLKEKPFMTLKRNLENSSDDWARAEFKLTNDLPQGDYLVTAEVSNPRHEKDWNVFWFSVSDLGLIVKRDETKVLVRAMDLNTLKAKSNADVQILALSNDKARRFVKLGSGESGADGLVSFSLADKNLAVASNSLYVVGSIGQARAYGGVWAQSGARDTDRYKTYFYTERPVYRLGQTVFFKTITRELKEGELKTPQPGLTISAEVQGPDDNKIWKKDFTSNNHGSFAGTFDIPAEGKTGAYQILLTYPDGSSDYKAFEVAEYRKPEYEVTVTPLTPRVVAGQKIKALIKARYYFGGAVSNAVVKYSIYSSTDWDARWRLMPRPEWLSYFDDWESEDEVSYSSYGGDFISDGSTQTDQNGEAIVEIETKRPEVNWDTPTSYDYTDKRYKIQAEVTDLSRMSVIGSGTCSVTMGDFELFLENASYVAKAGEALTSQLTVVDHAGKPVANQKVNAALCRWPWNSTTHEYRPREVISQLDIVTDAAGKALVKFDTEKSFASDTYYMTASATDAGRHDVFTETSVWMASDVLPSDQFENGGQEALTIKFDKPAYKVGESARVAITAPVKGNEGLDALISIEGDTLKKYWTIPLDQSTKLIEVPVKPEYEPNVFVAVTFVGAKHVLHQQSKSLRVSPQEHFLALSVKADKEKYHPGETAEFKITASLPSGVPAPDTELSFGLVDESIYAIRPDATQDIVKFFYSQRANAVATICTFPEEYSGGPDKIEPRVRKDFRDTAVWLPELKTDAKGIAIARVKLPDNLTTWRATVRACTLGNNFGSAIEKIVSTQDLIVRLATPRFFTVGDQGCVAAIVQNYTKNKQVVKLSLSLAGGINTKEPLVQKLTVVEGASVRYTWPVKLTGAGEVTLGVKAVGQTAGDAMEKKLMVVPLGIPAFSATSGVLYGAAETRTISLQEGPNAVPGSAQYKLTIAPTSIGPVLGNFDTLIDYPYGCTEQTMSRLVPSVVALTLYKKLRLPIASEQAKIFKRVYKMSMEKLESYQHDDGGWGWWQTDESNIYLTSLVLTGFKDLERVGYSVDHERQKKAVAWLKTNYVLLCKQLKDPKREKYDYEDCERDIDLANACYVLSIYGEKPDKQVTQYLTGRLKQLPPEALSYLSMALQSSGVGEQADRVYKQLLAVANRTDKMIDWEPNRALLNRIGFPLRYGVYSYRFTGVESTALALRAVLHIDGKNLDLIESIKNWILSQREKDGWGNTKTTAQVFMALLEEQLAFSTDAAQSPSVRVSEDGQLIKELHWVESELYGPETVMKPRETTRDNPNSFAPNTNISASGVPLSPLGARASRPPDKATPYEPILNVVQALAPWKSGTPTNITLTKEGPGRIFYSSLLTYQRQLQPGENAPGMAIPQGLSLERSFSRIGLAATTSDGKLHFRATKLSENTVDAGETILMKVKLTSPISLPYVLMECALPSGGEVVDDQSKSSNLDSSSDDKSTFAGDWREVWWSHQDVLDDRIVFFVTNLPSGVSEFPVLVRMEMPGTFQMNPVKLEGMYTNKVRAYSPPTQIKVVE